jgi:hypothetical protein
MLKTYTYKGTDFQTLTIPKGTALFRGIDYDPSLPKNSIFSDLIGNEGCIAPSHQVFFYPAPYVSNAVNNYKIHVLFVTNYDLEVMLLIKPSHINRATAKKDYGPDDIITQCTLIGNIDECGKPMRATDPCLTKTMIAAFPQIAGFIAIAETDALEFIELYARFMKEERLDELKIMLPTISSNSRGIVSIPEIVLHPMRLRTPDAYSIPLKSTHPYDIMADCNMRKSRYNYFPLVYIYIDGIFNFKDLGSITNLNKLAKAKVPPSGGINPILTRMKIIMRRLLSPKGHMLDGVVYRLSMDARTGYYIFDNVPGSKRTSSEIKTDTAKGPKIVPFEYPLHKKEYIMHLLSLPFKVTPPLLDKYLSYENLGLKAEYALDKTGNLEGVNFHIDEVFEPKLFKKDMRKTPKTRKNKFNPLTFVPKKPRNAINSIYNSNTTNKLNKPDANNKNTTTNKNKPDANIRVAIITKPDARNKLH